MPKPSKKELRNGKKGKDQFISRCVSHLIDKEGRKPDQAAAICHSYYRKAKRGKNSE